MSESWTIHLARTTETGYVLELARGFDRAGRPKELRGFDFPADSPALAEVDLEDGAVVAQVLARAALAQIEAESAPDDGVGDVLVPSGTAIE